MSDNFFRLQTDNLTLSVGARSLLHQLNWQVNAGEFWCILGRNGAGKTTLLRHLAGLQAVPEQGGTISYNNRSLASWPLEDLAKLRAYLSQGRNDAFAYRVIETVLASRYPYHDGAYWESEHDLNVAASVLADMDVSDLAERDVRSLSGGERQRVAIAAALAQETQCLLLDEPTNSLDLSHQVAVMQLLAQRCSQHKKAVLVVSHDLNLAFRYATHALLLMPGGGWQAGPVEQVMNQSALSQCLEHPIEIVRHGAQCLFLPK